MCRLKATQGPRHTAGSFVVTVWSEVVLPDEPQGSVVSELWIRPSTGYPKRSPKVMKASQRSSSIATEYAFMHLRNIRKPTSAQASSTTCSSAGTRPGTDPSTAACSSTSATATICSRTVPRIFLSVTGCGSGGDERRVRPPDAGAPCRFDAAQPLPSCQTVLPGVEVALRGSEPHGAQHVVGQVGDQQPSHVFTDLHDDGAAGLGAGVFHQAQLGVHRPASWYEPVVVLGGQPQWIAGLHGEPAQSDIQDAFLLPGASLLCV
ncbi:hypothetical protein SUDANB178_07448 [Streptomyces sp. enrichment culture]